MIVSQGQDWPRLWLRAAREQIAQLARSRALRVSLGVFLTLRLLTLVAALLMARDMSAARPDLLRFNLLTLEGNPSGITYYASLPAHAPFAQVVEPWRRYDTAWYILIAMQGYFPDTRIVFPPLYPALIRFVELFCVGNFVLAALIVSNVFCAAAFYLFYRLTAWEWGDRVATRALILLAAFPTGFYLVAGYTEPLFLTFTLGAFLAALDRRWWLAGGLAFLASLTRLQGVVLCLPLGWIAYVQWREVGRRALIDRLPALIGAPLGTLAFVAFITYGQLGSMEQAYAEGWKLASHLPWDSVITYMQRLFTGITAAHEHNNAFTLLLMAALGVVVLLRFQRAYALYVWSTLAVILVRYHFGEGLEGAQFESAIRYVLLLFPCFAAGALILQRPRAFWLTVAVMALMQVYLLNDFVHWVWVA
ncbi:MAG: hypothetical protein J0M07_28205 [Anaerolineae bacterium]|nr:hypothetical protein [Anaerolineae bacterium]